LCTSAEISWGTSHFGPHDVVLTFTAVNGTGLSDTFNPIVAQATLPGESGSLTWSTNTYKPGYYNITGNFTLKHPQANGSRIIVSNIGHCDPSEDTALKGAEDEPPTTSSNQKLAAILGSTIPAILLIALLILYLIQTTLRQRKMAPKKLRKLTLAAAVNSPRSPDVFTSFVGSRPSVDFIPRTPADSDVVPGPPPAASPEFGTGTSYSFTPADLDLELDIEAARLSSEAPDEASALEDASSLLLSGE
jgi:hypothetical protein